MKSFFVLSIFQLFLFSSLVAQDALKLLTASLSNSAVQADELRAKRITNNPVRKGHDVYNFRFQVLENCVVKPTSIWIKDKTTLPLQIVQEMPIKQIKLKKGDFLSLKAEHDGIFPYQKSPKRFNTPALIGLEINGEKKYIEIKGFAKED